MADLYKAPVTVAAERYQELLESEVIVQMISQARDTLDGYDFDRFMEILFPKAPKVPSNGNEG